ncbi:MAG: DUF1573 domain-containing protein [Rikenellaceae bacterium]
MTRILLIIGLLFGYGGAFAQSIKFSEPQWDFGTIKEDGGVVSHIFEFVNSGDKPIVITNVQTTCGCTTPEYSKRPIVPNATSTIEIKYDPLYRPGSFARDISIYTSADSEPVIVKIRGVATPRERSVEERFPYILGDGVRISSLYVFMNNVSHNNPTQSRVEIINTSATERRIEISGGDERFMSVEWPSTLAAGEAGYINVAYDIPSRSGFYGELRDNLVAYVDGRRSGMEVTTRAFVIEDFGADAKKGAVSGHFSKKFINFEAFNLKSDDLTRDFSIENLGSETLLIRGVDLPEGVEITTLDGGDPRGRSVGSAEILELKVTLKGEELELGPFVKYATFIVNDPEQPVVRIKIVGEVSK